MTLVRLLHFTVVSFSTALLQLFLASYAPTPPPLRPSPPPLPCMVSRELQWTSFLPLIPPRHHQVSRMPGRDTCRWRQHQHVTSRRHHDTVPCPHPTRKQCDTRPRGSGISCQLAPHVTQQGGMRVVMVVGSFRTIAPNTSTVL